MSIMMFDTLGASAAGAIDHAHSASHAICAIRLCAVEAAVHNGRIKWLEQI